MRVPLIHRPDEFARVRASVEAATKPTARPRPALPLGAPARATAVLTDLRTTDSSLGMRRPVAPQPVSPDASPAEQVAALRDAALARIRAILRMGPLDKDWSARIAADWKHLDARWDHLADATAREFSRLSGGAEYAPRVMTAPLLSELTELTDVQLPDWRKALAAHAEDELALFDAEMAVAL